MITLKVTTLSNLPKFYLNFDVRNIPNNVNIKIVTRSRPSLKA